MHVRSHAGTPFTPLSADNPEPIDFRLDNFEGRCIFIHRPAWSYDNPDTADPYPFRQLFHGRKRLWEWRLQGRFKRRPGVLYLGIELEEYVPVNFATRSLMRAILPLIQAALQCKLVHHEVGDPNEPELRPTVVAPLWAADLMLVHDDPKEAPDLAAPELPPGFNRMASRQYWETLWAGDGPTWGGATPEGPTFTFALWGPSQLLDLRAWVFRKLPLMWGRELAMEPFCGKQPVHAVVYELLDGELTSKHYQSEKTYIADLRMMSGSVWVSRAFGDPLPEGAASCAAVEDDTLSFCSAVSGESPDPDQQERHLLAVEASDFQPMGLHTSNSRQRPKSFVERVVSRLLPCARCRKRRSSRIPTCA